MKQVLDKGFVDLVDTMGNDLSIVRAARVSYGKDSTDPEKDKKLINFLLKNDHGTPFEHTSLTFHVKAPIFVTRQWMRHRIGNSFNEISGRYMEMKEEFYIPSSLRTQIGKNYQYTPLLNSTNGIDKIIKHYETTFKFYKELLTNGVAKEQARAVLPLGMYTEFYWTVNTRSLMNFITLRLEEHAQEEIREYARVLLEYFKETFPWTCEAFLNKIETKVTNNG
jgi:thymidylate synthase (FAD)